MPRVRFWLLVFMAGLVLSGVTAVPLQSEVVWVSRLLGASPQDTVETTSGFLQWVVRVRDGVTDGYGRYPFLAYGTDWLAFAHIAIALAFIGPLRDPVRNLWVVDWGMILCVLVIPTALVFGALRGIPFFHQMIDCMFGVVGIIPLYAARREILKLSA